MLAVADTSPLSTWFGLKRSTSYRSFIAKSLYPWRFVLSFSPRMRLSWWVLGGRSPAWVVVCGPDPQRSRRFPAKVVMAPDRSFLILIDDGKTRRAAGTDRASFCGNKVTPKCR